MPAWEVDNLYPNRILDESSSYLPKRVYKKHKLDPQYCITLAEEWLWDDVNKIKLTSFPTMNSLQKLILLGVPLSLECFISISNKLPNLKSFHLLDCSDSCTLEDGVKFDPTDYFFNAVNVSKHLNHLLSLKHLESISLHRLSAQNSQEANDFIQIIQDFSSNMTSLITLNLYFSTPDRNASSECFDSIHGEGGCRLIQHDKVDISVYCPCVPPYHGKYIHLDSDDDE